MTEASTVGVRQIMIRTANTHIDLQSQLGNGIRAGSLVLVEGSASTGKSVLSQHLAYGGLASGHSVAYFASEHNPRDFVVQMGSIGLGVSNHFGAQKLRVCSTEEFSSEGAPEHQMARLASEMERLPTQYKVIVVDAVTDIANPAHPRSLIGFFSDCLRLCDYNRTIILSVNSKSLEEKLLDELASLCDTHFSLRAAKLGRKLLRTLEIPKAHGEPQSGSNMMGFVIEPKLGMRMIPVG